MVRGAGSIRGLPGALPAGEADAGLCADRRFHALAYLKIHGKPAVLLDLPQREFTIFGFTFLSTDTLLLALALITLILGICLVTALAGRVWCGWMCPQTVYMEFVFRPLERLFDGPPGARHRPGRKRTTPRTVAKYAVYLVDFGLPGPHLPGLLRRRGGIGRNGSAVRRWSIRYRSW